MATGELMRDPASPPVLPGAAVIIPTRNRPDALRVAVRSVLAQSALPRQLIVVDQSDTETPRRGVEEEFRLAGPRAGAIRLDYIHDPGIAGVSQARNAGVPLVTAEVVFFVDDDVELDPGYIEELLRAHQRHPEAVALSGVPVNYPRPPWPLHLWQVVFARGVFYDDRQPVYWNAARLRRSTEVAWSRRLGSALISVRAAAARQVAFDEGLQGVCDGEDVDYSLQLQRLGRLGIVSRARLVHRHNAIGRATDHWLTRVLRAELYLYHKNWDHGIKNRLAYAWLMCGCALVLAIGCARRLSLEPWRTARRSMREALRHRGRAQAA